MIKFTAPSQEEVTRQLSSNLPDGKAWGAKNLEGTNVRALVSACAAEFREIQLRIDLLSKEFDINLTNGLLPDWEASVGLPEECIGPLSELSDRRSAVILRLRRIPLVTKQEYEQIIFDITGLSITVTPGAVIELFPIAFPLKLSSGNPLFKLYVRFNDTIGGFPYRFPLLFLKGKDQIVKCVLEQIVPANVLLVFDPAGPVEAEPLVLDGSWMLDGTYNLNGNKIPA